MSNELSSIIEYGREERNIEFKRDESWDNLKVKIIKTCMAMANLRDGGYFVVGMNELDDGTFERQGISETNLGTYDRDTILTNINNYADPSVNLDLAIVKHENKKYLFIVIKEFSESPIVCKKDGADYKNRAIYYRSTSMPKTDIIKTYEEMKELIDHAVLKGTKKFMEGLNYVGLSFSSTPVVNDEIKFKKERGESN